MPTLLPFVRGGATKKVKSAASSAASGGSSGSGKSSAKQGGMQAFQKKFGGGGGGQQEGPEQAAAALAGKRLIPGQGLPHVTLHTVQVSIGSCLCCLGTRVFSDASLSLMLHCLLVCSSHRLAHLLVVVRFRQSASGPARTLVHAVGSFWYLAPQFTQAMISPNCSAFH